MTRPADARERYLDIAAKRFADVGFHGVSLAMLARDAGVTKQALLHFFGTKERLYAEVLTQLADRLCAAVDAAHGTSPSERFVEFFRVFANDAVARPDEARLVTRALLESDPSARRWPLKPFLDTLIDLARETPRWKGASEEVVLASLNPLIGATQYTAISTAAITGMYGETARVVVEAHMMACIVGAARVFVEPS